MSPYELAQQIYVREPCRRTFLEDLALHHTYGYVISTPHLFLMGRPVRTRAPYDQLIDITYTFSDPDAWFVWVAAGLPPWEIVRYTPFQLPYVMWERNNRLRCYRTQQINAIARKKFQARVDGEGQGRRNSHPTGDDSRTGSPSEGRSSP